jgi:hypothetical protein
VSLELAVLARLRAGPYGGRWLHGAVLGVEVDGDPRWRAGLNGVRPFDGAASPVDAWIVCGAGDLGRMLAGQAPEGSVGYRLGDRAGAPRLCQARALFALAALGWCGPWPDAAASAELDTRMRAAAQNIAVGPADATGALFAAGAPYALDAVAWRATDTVRGRVFVTAGLAGRDGAGHGCELLVRVSPRAEERDALRALRAAALLAAERDGRMPGRLDGPLPLSLRPAEGFPDGLPLASGVVPVWQVEG